MANYNKVLLMGNLTRDPEVRYTPKGTAVAQLGLAVNRVYTLDNGEKKEEVTFVDVDVWGRQAETAGQYLAKGRPVFVEGRLQMDTWDDKTTGQKRSKLKVVAERVQFLGSPRGASGEVSDEPPGGGQRAARPSRPAASAAPSEDEPPPDRGEDDNIPF